MNKPPGQDVFSAPGIKVGQLIMMIVCGVPIHAFYRIMPDKVRGFMSSLRNVAQNVLAVYVSITFVQVNGTAVLDLHNMQLGLFLFFTFLLLPLL